MFKKMTSAEYHQWGVECDTRERAGGVMTGWTAEHWADELRRKIAVCDDAENREAMTVWLEKLEMKTRLTIETTDDDRKSLSLYLGRKGLASREDVRSYIDDRLAGDMKVLNATRKRRESKDVEGQLVLPTLNIPLPD